MYWLIAIITLISFLVSAMLFHKLGEIEYNSENFPVYAMAIVILAVLALVWPFTWSVIIISAVSYILYVWLLKLINKRIKDKSDA